MIQRWKLFIVLVLAMIAMGLLIKALTGFLPRDRRGAVMIRDVPRQSAEEDRAYARFDESTAEGILRRFADALRSDLADADLPAPDRLREAALAEIETYFLAVPARFRQRFRDSSWLSPPRNFAEPSREWDEWWVDFCKAVQSARVDPSRTRARVRFADGREHAYDTYAPSVTRFRRTRIVDLPKPEEARGCTISEILIAAELLGDEQPADKHIRFDGTLGLWFTWHPQAGEWFMYKIVVYDVPPNTAVTVPIL